MQEKKKLRPVSAELVNEILNGGYEVSSYGCGSGSGSGGAGCGCGSGDSSGCGSGSGSGSGDDADWLDAEFENRPFHLDYPSYDWFVVSPPLKCICSGSCYASKKKGSAVEIKSGALSVVVTGTYNDGSRSHTVQKYNSIVATKSNGRLAFNGSVEVEIYSMGQKQKRTISVYATFTVEYDEKAKSFFGVPGDIIVS